MFVMMEKTLRHSVNDLELERWLNLKCRCFGDKGDVEDITEGQQIYMKIAVPLALGLLTWTSHASGHHIYCGI